jgi:hypothetical protein
MRLSVGVGVPDDFVRLGLSHAGSRVRSHLSHLGIRIQEEHLQNKYYVQILIMVIIFKFIKQGRH